MLNLNRTINHISKLDNTRIQVLRVDSEAVVLKLHQNGNTIALKLTKNQIEEMRKSLSLYCMSARCDISIADKTRVIHNVAIKTICLNRGKSVTFTSRGNATITLLETSAGIVCDITAQYKERDNETKDEWDTNLYLMTLFDANGTDRNSLHEIFENVALAMM